MSHLKEKLKKLERAVNPPNDLPFDKIIVKVMRRHPETGRPILTKEIVVNVADNGRLSGSNAGQNEKE